MKRTVNVLSKLNWGTRACAALALCATTAIALPAQIATLTTIHRFCSQSGCPDGAGPYAGLVQAANGGLYGTTLVGGTVEESRRNFSQVFERLHFRRYLRR